MNWIKHIDRALQRAFNWVISGEAQAHHKPTIHIHYEIHQHVHITPDDLYHKVLHKTLAEMPNNLALAPQEIVQRRVTPVKDYLHV